MEEPFHIKGAKGLIVQLAECCHPIPDDKIVAYITPNNGLQVHRTECPMLKHLSTNETMSSSWDQHESSTYTVPLQIFANDKIGVLSGITQIFEEANTNIEDINISGDRDRKELRILVNVKNTQQLKHLIHSLHTETAISEVSRLFQLSSGNTT